LHGSGRSTIFDVITNGRMNQMPAQEPILGEGRVHVLAAYIYSLSNKPVAAKPKTLRAVCPQAPGRHWIPACAGMTPFPRRFAGLVIAGSRGHPWRCRSGAGRNPASFRLPSARPDLHQPHALRAAA
jgi:hypothetical protein